MPDTLKPCPFCGGKGKVSFKDHLFIGYNGLGNRKICYRVQVICNKCRSRGKPIITEGLIDPWPYSTEWGNQYNPKSDVCKAQTEVFRPYVEQAIDAWNRRVGHEPAGECAKHNRAERGSWCGEEGEKDG